MNKLILFKEITNPEFHLIHFELPDAVLTPDALTTITPPDYIHHNFAHKGVILSGRGPVWLYGFLVHYYHPTKWIATFDPRLQGAIVVASHDADVQVGSIIPLSSEDFLKN